MPSGGARANSGPTSDPNSGRSAKRVGEWIDLPNEGCDLDAPDWPLSGQSARETQLWKSLWRRPQAYMWHRLFLADEVALYCRYFAEAEGVADDFDETPSAAAVAKAAAQMANARVLVRQHREMLGLSTAGLARLKWRIAVVDVGQPTAQTVESTQATGRARLEALQGGA